jgi:hypothetical protein
VHARPGVEVRAARSRQAGQGEGRNHGSAPVRGRQEGAQGVLHPQAGGGRYLRQMVRNTAVLQWILRVLASTAFRIARWRSIAERDKSARVRDQRSRRDQELQDTMATARVREGRLAARRARGRQRGCASAQARKAGRERAQVCGALSVWEIFA